jgi:hypothetical protein
MPLQPARRSTSSTRKRLDLGDDSMTVRVNIGFILFPELTQLDLTGPASVHR